MSDLTLLIMRIGFMVLLWIFIFSILYALRSDLFGATVRKLPSDSNAAAAGGSHPPSPVIAAPIVAAPPLAPILTPPSAAGVPLVNTSESAAQHLAATELVITSGVAAGTIIPLEEDIITVGRSSGSTLVIVDEYTSTYHARLHRSGEQWILTDLDSTNGTTLNGVRVTDSIPVPLSTPIKIGTTTFELRS